MTTNVFVQTSGNTEVRFQTVEADGTVLHEIVDTPPKGNFQTAIYGNQRVVISEAGAELAEPVPTPNLDLQGQAAVALVQDLGYVWDGERSRWDSNVSGRLTGDGSGQALPPASISRDSFTGEMLQAAYGAAGTRMVTDEQATRSLESFDTPNHPGTEVADKAAESASQ